MRRRWSPAAALRAVTAEAAPRLRSIGRSHTEAQRFRRAEDRDDLPVLKRKHEYACCAATRDAYGRLCIGWCGPECERRPA